jgi:ribose transport system permease protein
MRIGVRGSAKRENWLLVFSIAIILYSIAAIFSSSFRSLENIRNLVIQLTPLMLVTLGQTLVILTGGIDLSVGPVLSLSTVLAATLMVRIGVLPAIVVILIITALFGMINGLVITRLGINPFIMTLASMAIAQGSALYVLPGPGGKVPREFMNIIYYKDFLGLPLYTWIAAGIFIFIAFILYKRKFGFNVIAVGGNKEASFLAGINVNWVIIGTYVFSSLLAAMAGILMSARIAGGDPLVGQGFTLDSIGAAVVGGVSLTGGRGGVFSALGGVIILGSISNILNMLSINPYWQFVLKSAIIIATIAIAIRLENLGESKRVRNA